MRSFLTFFFSTKAVWSNLSKGNKNNREEILSSFWKIWEILVKLFVKKRCLISENFFEKNNISIFFSENIPKYVENHLLRDPETIKKKYQIVFKIWAKKKKKDRPVHHTFFLPSVNVKNLQIPAVNWKSKKIS